MHNDHHHDQRYGGKRQPGMKSGHDTDKADAVRVEKADFDEAFYQSVFRDASYVSSGRNWLDYAPAYRYGHATRARHRGRRFEDVEAELARNWDKAKADSRLLWPEARGAVHDAWRRAGADLRGGQRRRRDD
jgi:hypothetical protein